MYNLFREIISKAQFKKYTHFVIIQLISNKKLQSVLNKYITNLLNIPYNYTPFIYKFKSPPFFNFKNLIIVIVII